MEKIYNNIGCYITTAGLCIGAAVAVGAIFDFFYRTPQQKKALGTVKEFIDAAKAIEMRIKGAGLSTEFSVLTIKNKKAQQFITELHKFFDKKITNIFTLNALVHKFYQAADELGELFCFIGEIDAYYSIAMRMINAEGSKNQFCFAEFSNEDRPYIAAADFWNILIHDSVTNSINESRTITLTGSNAGGKSTCIKALLQNIVLAQSFGIATGTRFIFTPFTAILSYFSKSDDILNNKSLFMVEAENGQYTADAMLRHEKNNGKTFLALDEPFTGTDPKTGEELGTKQAELISENFPNTFLIYSTHFEKPTELAMKHANVYEKNLYANYKMDGPKVENGNVTYPYTLSHGINTAHIGERIPAIVDMLYMLTHKKGQWEEDEDSGTKESSDSDSNS